MLSKEQKNKIKETLARETLMDVTFHNDGLITAKKKFKALSGRNSSMYAEKIKKLIPEVDVKSQLIRKDSIVIKFEVKENTNGIE